jgi:hypothetical protein
MTESSNRPRTRTRVRPLGQRKDAQNQRIAATVIEADAPVDLVDLFPAKEVLRVRNDGEVELPQKIADRFRYIERYHRPKTEVQVKPGKTRATRNADQKLNPYTEDFIFQTLHQLLLANMPMDQIALKFDVSLSTVYKWRAKMIAKMAEEVKKADPLPILGETLSTYKTIAAEGHRLMMSGKTGHDKRAGAEIALKAMGDQMKVLQLAGFFNNPLMKVQTADSEDSRTQGANALMDLAKSFLGGAPAPQLPAPEGQHRNWGHVPEGAEIVDVSDEEDN